VPQPTINYRARASIESRAHAQLRDTERWDSLGKVIAAPAPQPEAIYARNLEKYGDKLGPTVDWLRAKGKSWEEIIESASRSGGKDLGF